MLLRRRLRGLECKGVLRGRKKAKRKGKGEEKEEGEEEKDGKEEWEVFTVSSLFDGEEEARLVDDGDGERGSRYSTRQSQPPSRFKWWFSKR